MKEAKVSGVQLLKPGEDPAVMLYFVDEAFDQMMLPVQMCVVAARLLPVGAWGNHRRHAPPQNVLAKPLGVIPFVSQHILTFIAVYQPLGLRDVVLLSSSQDEAQGIAKTIHAHVDLGAEPTAAPSQGLGCLATFLGDAPVAQGWARTTVLSMMRYSISESPAKC